MPAASWAQTSFLGGEWSKTAQGRFEDPAYEIALNVCLNGLPIESGAWTRRPGTAHAGTTRGGGQGRVIEFNFAQASAYTVEFTDGHVRFRSGTSLVTTNDSVGITSISTANPAVVQTAAAVTWATGDQAYFTLLGTTAPTLQNRVFALTKVDTTHFSLSDPVTGANIDGSTLGWISTPAALINRVLDLATPYVGSLWSSVRGVQTDLPLITGSTPAMVLLHASFAPYLLQVTAAPTSSAFATFSLAPATFKDGPYLDPVPGGALLTPTNVIGVINLTLSFAAWDSTRAYQTGDFVTFSSVNYQSLSDANFNNQPDTHPALWKQVSAGSALGPNGFVGSDVGRMIRLLSEPSVWFGGTSYGTGALVAYGTPATYWVSLTSSNLGNIPGTDTTHWAIATNAARWTWGKITGLLNQISQSTGVAFGSMTGAGGLAAAFDGVVQQDTTHGAEEDATSVNSAFILDSYVGKNYSGSPQKVAFVTLHSSTDAGFTFSVINTTLGPIDQNRSLYFTQTSFFLRGNNSAPASPSDGTLLGSAQVINSAAGPLVITSKDQNTAYNYIWVEITSTVAGAALPAGAAFVDITYFHYIAEMQIFSPLGTGTSTGVTFQILGDPLLSENPVRTFRLGLYSNTTGWPAVGTYHEDGRLWLSGAVPNRIDGSRSDDPFNMAPTDPNGSVPDNAAISYTFASKDINPIRWMESDDRGIICGTQGAEWLVSATTQNLALSPTNIQAHPVTHYGSENIEPRRAGGTLVFVQRFGRKLLEYFADVFSGRLTAPNLTRDSRHLTESGLAEIAYQQELAPVVWGRRTDGTLVGWTYKRENMMSSQGPSFIGGHRHALGSGRLVESICAGPSTGGDLDTLTMVTNDPATSVRHVEILTDLFDEDAALTTAWFLDDAVAPSSYTYDLTLKVVILNGLWHLNGKTVSVFMAGLDAGDYVVSGGQITVHIDGSANPYLTSDFVQPFLTDLPAVVGFTYNSDAQVLRPGPQKNSGAANGPAFGKVSRAHQIAALVEGTVGSLNGTTAAGLQFGSFFDKLNPAIFRNPDQSIIPPTGVFDGVYWSPVDNPYTFDEGQLCWRISRPVPATIAAFSAFQMTQDR